MSDTVVIDGDMSLTSTIDGECGAFIRLGQNPVIEPLNVTENGTYSVPEGVDGYSPVTVALPEYEGAYEVEPSAEMQTLATAGKVMAQDVTVKATEPYGLWTDIIGLYLGRDSALRGLFTPNTSISNSTGEVIENSDNATCEAYLLVNESYKYVKGGGGRIYGLHCYDENKQYLGNAGVMNNTTNGGILPSFLPGTRYIRTVTNRLTNNWGLSIIRIE